MQQTMNTYFKTDRRKLYWEKVSSGIINTQCEKILKLLSDYKPHPLPQLLSLGISQYNARIFDLRKMGFRIDNVRDVDGNTYFMLMKDMEGFE